MSVKGKDVAGRVRQHLSSPTMSTVRHSGHGDHLVSPMRFAVWCKPCGCSDLLGAPLSKRELRHAWISGPGQCS